MSCSPRGTGSSRSSPARRRSASPATPAYAWTARRAFPELRIRPSSFNRALVRDVTGVQHLPVRHRHRRSRSASTSTTSSIGAALGTSAVAVYAVTLRLADYQRQLCNQFNGFLFPIAVRFGAGGSSDALESMLIEGTRIALDHGDRRDHLRHRLRRSADRSVDGARLRGGRRSALRPRRHRRRARRPGSARQHPARHRPPSAGRVRLARRGDRQSGAERGAGAPLRHAGRRGRHGRAGRAREPVHPAAGRLPSVPDADLDVPAARAGGAGDRRDSGDRRVHRAARSSTHRRRSRRFWRKARWSGWSTSPRSAPSASTGTSGRAICDQCAPPCVSAPRPVPQIRWRGSRRDATRPGAHHASSSRPTTGRRCSTSASITCAGSDSLPATRSSSSTTDRPTTPRPSSHAIRPAIAVPLHLLHELAPGKSRAIARALAAATGDILAFTDDDVNVDDGWLDAMRDAMADPAVALVGGPVTPRWEPTVPRWIRRARDRHPRLGAPIALLDYGDQPCELGSRTVLGANLAVRREVFTQVGGFPTHLGKLRGTLLSGEDHELCRRVQAAGFRAMYCPKARRRALGAGRPRPRLVLSCAGSTGPASPTPSWTATDPRPRGRALHGLPLYLVARAATASAARAGRAADVQPDLGAQSRHRRRLRGRLRGRTLGADALAPARHAAPSPEKPREGRVRLHPDLHLQPRAAAARDARGAADDDAAARLRRRDHRRRQQLDRQHAARSSPRRRAIAAFPSIAPARNARRARASRSTAACEAARGDIVALTDDDVLAATRTG